MEDVGKKAFDRFVVAARVAEVSNSRPPRSVLMDEDVFLEITQYTQKQNPMFEPLPPARRVLGIEVEIAEMPDDVEFIFRDFQERILRTDKDLLRKLTAHD